MSNVKSPALVSALKRIQQVTKKYVPEDRYAEFEAELLPALSAFGASYMTATVNGMGASLLVSESFLSDEPENDLN